MRMRRMGACWIGGTKTAHGDGGWLVGGAYPEGAGNAGGRDGRKRFKDQGCKKGKGWE